MKKKEFRLSFEEKVKIWEYYDHGLTPYQISKELGYALGTVKEAIEQYQDHKDIQYDREGGELDTELRKKIKEAMRRWGNKRERR